LKQSRQFFKLPTDVKLSILHDPDGDADNHRGFVPDGLTYVSQLEFEEDRIKELRKTTPERKQSLEMGNPHSSAFENVPRNRLPTEEQLPGIRGFVEKWFDTVTALNHTLLRCCSRVLGLPDEDYLSRLQKYNNCHMTWNHFPQINMDLLRNGSYRRLNAHTDFGQLTLLFPDPMGGLEVNDGERYRPVAYKPGTMVVNIGDLMERQTNGRWKSSLHRVVAPENLVGRIDSQDEETYAAERYSLVYFGSPDPLTMVKTLPGCESKGHWEPSVVQAGENEVTCQEWIQKRVAAEFLGPEALQIKA
jgi:isopenicillin N synthase-like dioxygenase